MISLQTILFALLGGVLPALLWLWFWLKEDKARPEPRGLLILTFVLGMVSVLFAIFFENIAVKFLTGEFFSALILNSPLDFLLRESYSIAIAAGPIEELVKYAAVALFVLGREANDEPIDAIIYMITVALGFAALENTLFLLNTLVHGEFIDTILTGNLRFFGATLLHTLASAVVGSALAISFYKTTAIRIVSTIIGIVIAIILHSLFNFFIIASNGEKILTIFFFVWIGIIALILLFEKVKKLYNRDLIK